jgi:hypothetical protein
MKSMGISIFTQEELLELKDPQKVPVGSGMMDANPEFSGDFEGLQLPFDEATVLKKCFDCGNRYIRCVSCDLIKTTQADSQPMTGLPSQIPTPGGARFAPRKWAQYPL